MRRFAVIGLGNFGYHLCVTLSKNGAEVLAIDKEIELVEQIKNEVTRAICVDTTQEKNLQVAGLLDMDAVIVTMGERSVEASIMTTALIARLGVKWLIARSTSDLHGQILKLVGAQEVINPEQFVAERLAQRVAVPGIVDIVPISEDGYSLSDIAVPSQFVNKTLMELNLRAEFGINVIAIKRQTKKLLPDGTEQFRETVNHTPGPYDILKERDIISCIGSNEAIERFARLK